MNGTGILGGSVSGVPAYCEVTVTLTHPGDGDHAKVWTWPPAQDWNSRFQALGGSAYAAGDNGVGLGTAVKNGYAAATTDAGAGDVLDTGWALTGKGQVDIALLKNFADRSRHEMALVGKQIVDEVYGKAASYSYWNGCSTGGRQGYMEAQLHPDDFDGILADAPAINWDQFEVAALWPQVAMNETKIRPNSCKLNAFNQAALKACDKLDGIEDGLVSDAERCTCGSLGQLALGMPGLLLHAGHLARCVQLGHPDRGRVRHFGQQDLRLRSVRGEPVSFAR